LIRLVRPAAQREPVFMSLLIRDSRPADVPALTAIFGHAVLHGNASFELVPPDAAEVARRRDALLAAGFPHLVAEDATGRVLGFTLENSVYVAPDCQGQGIGRAMLPRLIERCEQAGFRLMIAVIGDSANHASIRLHASCGFRHAGLLPAIGWKHERWLDSVLMVRPLGPGASEPPPPGR
jgi:L-amino acid N-acyltransferase YncA